MFLLNNHKTGGVVKPRVMRATNCIDPGRGSVTEFDGHSRLADSVGAWSLNVSCWRDQTLDLSGGGGALV